MTNIKNAPNYNRIKTLWLYCIQHKIDIERTEINNTVIILEDGFGLNSSICTIICYF